MVFKTPSIPQSPELNDEIEYIDIDQVMRKHWREKSSRQMPNEKEFNLLISSLLYFTKQSN